MLLRDFARGTVRVAVLATVLMMALAVVVANDESAVASVES